MTIICTSCGDNVPGVGSLGTSDQFCDECAKRLGMKSSQAQPSFGPPRSDADEIRDVGGHLLATRGPPMTAPERGEAGKDFTGLRDFGEIADDEAKAVCRSCASFIAEIDARSEDVAAYLQQRLGPIIRLAYFARSPDVFRAAMRDARQLVGWSRPVPPTPPLDLAAERAAHEATRGELDELRLSTNDALDAARDTLAECVAQLAATKAELGKAQVYHRESLKLLADTDVERMHLNARLGVAEAAIGALAKERDLAKAKADAHERDWYAAKTEFGDAMAAQRERLRASESAHAETRRELEVKDGLYCIAHDALEKCEVRLGNALVRGDAPIEVHADMAHRMFIGMGGDVSKASTWVAVAEAVIRSNGAQDDLLDASVAREAETWRTAFSIVKDVSEREERACRRHSAAFAESIPRKTMSLKRAHEMAARQSSAVGAYIEQEMLAARAEREKKT